jgi:TetR/AcrR family transcriptional regulator
MGKVTYKEKERQRREDEILQKAAQLLTERGYANLNMDDLADVVGISKPTLYQHFKSKDDLIGSVICESFRILDDQLRQILTGTPLDRIQKMMHWMLKSRYSRGSVLGALDQEMAWKIFKTNEQIAKGRADFHAQLHQLVTEAQQLGEIDAKLPTQVVVRSMFCLQASLADPVLKAEMAESEDKLNAAIDAVVTMFIRGIMPTPITLSIATTATNETLKRN